jgi:hypothetical protein
MQLLMEVVAFDETGSTAEEACVTVALESIEAYHGRVVTVFGVLL